ncbi:MAG: hypothetical protein Kapaf2KO_21420 [Candidatus Kapaibacteriales bacterium]
MKLFLAFFLFIASLLLAISKPSNPDDFGNSCFQHNHKFTSDIKNSDIDNLDTLISNDGLFRVIYFSNDTTVAPPKFDGDSNGHPDFIDSVAFYLDFAYHAQVDSFGLPSPIVFGSDTLIYDVIVTDIEATYGFVQTTETKDRGYLSRMTIDNDFQSESMYSKGYDAIKVTTMHEFHHSIQMIAGRDFQSIKYTEATATYLEYRFFPEIPDYLQYILGSNYPNSNGLSLNATLSNQNGILTNIYSYSTFFHLLYEVYGDEPFLQYFDGIMQDFDSKFSIRGSDLIVLDSILENIGSTLDAETERYARWVYNAVLGKEGDTFSQADMYPQMGFTSAARVKDLTDDGALVTFSLSPYTIRYTRLISPSTSDFSSDTIDIISYDHNFEDVAQSLYPERSYSLTISDEGSGSNETIEEDRYYATISQNALEFTENIFIPYLGGNINTIVSALPMPYKNGRGRLLLPVDKSSRNADAVNISVYDANGRPLLTKTGTVELTNDGLGNALKGAYLAETDIEDFLAGVYFAQTVVGDKSQLVKIVITGE